MKNRFNAPPSQKGKMIKGRESIAPPPSAHYPSFSFRHLSVARDFCLAGCSDADKIELVKTLHRLSVMSWNQIMMSDRHKAGSEKITQDEIKPHLPSHITPDVTLIVLRFSGLKPMVGYRDGGVFQVLFLDPNFKCYSH